MSEFYCVYTLYTTGNMSCFEQHVHFEIMIMMSLQWACLLSWNCQCLIIWEMHLWIYHDLGSTYIVILGNTFDVPHNIKLKTLIGRVSQRQCKQSANTCIMFQVETFKVITSVHRITWFENILLHGFCCTHTVCSSMKAG